MNTAQLRNLGVLLMVLVLVGGILACDVLGGAAKPTITITAPTSDAQFEEGYEVNVLSSASDAKGMTRVELYVDGDLFRTDSSPSADGETSLAMAQTWTARDLGVHTLSVIAYNVDGTASDPWAVSVEVVPAGGVVATATPTTSGGGPPAATNTPEPPPEATATTEPPPEETETPPEDTPEPSATPEPGKPDLVLDGLSVVPSDPDWGDSIEVNVDVSNMGTEASGPYKVLFRWGGGDFDVCEWDKTSLPPMNGGTLHCTVDHIYQSYTTEATVDWRNTVEESNEDNNSMTRRVEVGPAPPDLHITEIRVQPASPEQGSEAMVGVRIHNQGGTEARNFKVRWLSGEPSASMEWTVTSLAPGASKWVQDPYTYTGRGHFNTRAFVDVDDDVDEINEDNNELTKEIDVVHP